MSWRKAVMVLTAVLPACSSMRPVESPVAYLERNNPSQVRVYAADGELYVLRDPQLRGDTVRGFEALLQEELSVSLNGVRRMEAMQPDKGRTTLLIGALTALGAAGIYMAANAGDGKGLICDDYTLGQRCRPAPAVLRFAIPLR